MIIRTGQRKTKSSTEPGEGYYKGLSKFGSDFDKHENQRVIISGVEYVPGSYHRQGEDPKSELHIGPNQ